MSGNRTKIFLFFSPLSRLCHSSSFRLLFSRLVYPYTQVHRGRPDGPPRRAQSQDYPRPARGDVGQGRGLFILLLKCLNVCRFPPPSSRSTNCVTVLNYLTKIILPSSKLYEILILFIFIVGHEAR